MQIQLTIQPRVQKEKWSLYWKESMSTKTELIDAYTETVETSETVCSIQKRIANKFSWEPLGTLYRLEGFEAPWERAIYQGKELKPEATLEENGIQKDVAITFVRIVLVAEGWKISNEDDIDSSTDEDDF